MRHLLVLVLLVVLASACQVRLGIDVGVDRDASGSFEFAVGIDGELAAELREAGVDLLSGLEGIREREQTWVISEESTDDGGVTVRASAPFAGPDEFVARARSVHAGLDDEDMRIFEDLRLRQLEGGAVAFEGRVGFQPPAAPGAEGEALAFDADDLERLLDERGEELVRYDLRVTLPAPPREHDADEVDGTTLTWHVPVGSMQDVRAVSERPGSNLVLYVAVGIGTALVAGFVTALVLRRRDQMASFIARTLQAFINAGGSAPPT